MLQCSQSAEMSKKYGLSCWKLGDTTLHIYKIQAKFIFDPNLNGTLPSVYICSVRMQGDQVASEKVLPPFAYIAGLVTMDTGITRDLLWH